jgi:murein DD-endopeptidase MepM/ murein hydrolase activator NlpD
VPQAPPSMWSRVAVRALATSCAFLLLAGSATTPAVQAATELGNQISSGRRSQSYYESAMLAQDAAISRIKAQTKLTKRALKEAKRAVTRSKPALRSATAVVQQRSARLGELERLHADTPAEEIPAGYADRLRAARKELDKAKARRQLMGQRDRTALRMRSARQYRLNALKRQLRAAVSRRDAAAGGLGSYIVQMTRLAQERAEIQSSVRLSSSGVGFTWPSVGRISQTYGCTGFRLNPPRGSCRHFHDGLDIVSGYGSRVSSAADGVVAYAGWNPWDEGGRAWMMVVSHPDGYVTRYGHLLPTSPVRVGQFVRQGEAIGKMGNTGRSTGTHLHFELLRGGTTVNPWGYLPEGMVTIKVKDDKKSAKKSAKSKSAKDGKVAVVKAKAARGAATKKGAATAAAKRAAQAGRRGARPDKGTPGAAKAAQTVPEVSDQAATSTPFSASVSDPDSVVCRPSAEAIDGVTASSSAGPDSAIASTAQLDTGGSAGPAADPCAILGTNRGGDDDGTAARSLRRAPDTSTPRGALVRAVPMPSRGTSPLPE